MKVKYIGNSNPLRFINGKIYEVIGRENNSYRIIDETGEDYLYSLKHFELVDEKNQQTAYLLEKLDLYTNTRYKQSDLPKLLFHEQIPTIKGLKRSHFVDIFNIDYTINKDLKKICIKKRIKKNQASEEKCSGTSRCQ